MTPRATLAAARAALTALQPPVPVYLRRTEVPQQEPDLYVVIDLIADTPEATYDGEGGSVKLLQVTTWSRGRQGPAFDHAERVRDALAQEGFRRVQSRYPDDDNWFGVQADFRTH